MGTTCVWTPYVPTLRITPDATVPIDQPVTGLGGLLDKVDAAVGTVTLLSEHGLKIKAPSEEDKDAAGAIAAAFASNPEVTNKKATVKNVAQLTPPALLLTQQVLRDYAHSVVTSATQIRHLVTNKLIQETENPDPKVRIKALELLGKTLGLFVDRVETEDKTARDADSIRAELEQRIARLMG